MANRHPSSAGEEHAVGNRRRARGDEAHDGPHGTIQRADIARLRRAVQAALE